MTHPVAPIDSSLLPRGSNRRNSAGDVWRQACFTALGLVAADADQELIEFTDLQGFFLGSGISHGENPFAAGGLRAAGAMESGALKQGAAKDGGGVGERGYESIAFRSDV